MPFSPKMVERFRVPPGTKVRLKDWPTKWDVPRDLEDLNKDDLKAYAAEFVHEKVLEVANCQDLLWADGRRTVLIIFQGMDAAGKDSTIKHVTSGMNPAGLRVVSFKQPTTEELKHHYLWRYVRNFPELGTIGIFNRSHYEEVGIVRVYPQLLRSSAVWEHDVDEDFWLQRYADITHMESQLARNGTAVVKFFLHISRDEQGKRLLQRLEDPSKHWKFDMSDVRERARWDDYQQVYETMITHTSTEDAPWWIIPADRKWAMRVLVAQVIANTMHSLALRYPPVTEAKRSEIDQAMQELRGQQAVPQPGRGRKSGKGSGSSRK
jgi:PPK2 family polyphosphate:nucleotide phosphotransferase